MSLESEGSETARRAALLGTLAAGLGYGIWGLSVAFYKWLGHVAPLEVLAHRAIWSVVFTLGVLLLVSRVDALKTVLSSPGMMARLAFTSFLIGSNWFVFIWAIGENRVLESSLGYYINPLVSVLMGVVLLGERLSRAHVVAVGMAAIAVMILTLSIGVFPWISLYLALTFALYGYVRKVTPVDAAEGLLVETALLVPFAFAYLFWLGTAGESISMVDGDWETRILLALTGPMTAVPLLLFTFGARRIRLTTLGLMQYIAPTLHFALAVFVYGEPFGATHLVTFAIIWMALAVFSADSIRTERALRRRVGRGPA